MSKFQKSIFTIAVMIFTLGTALTAQNDQPFADLPPTSEFGKCYAKCRIPSTYETVTLKKLVKEASTVLHVVPATYETVTEKMLDTEGTTNYRVIPATYKTTTEQIMAEPEKTVIRTIPAVYKTETDRILVSQARGEWVRKKKSSACISDNPDDCYVACYVEIPATYRTESRQVLVEAAKTTETTIPAVYKTVTHKVIDTPARVEEIPVPATYKTVTKRVLKTPEQVTEETIPAVYKNVTERRLVKEGGFTQWQEVLCEAKTTSNKIYEVQKALQAAGYNPGVIDGVMGLNTRNALTKYQNDKGLPVGNLNIKTLKALGVAH